MAEAEELTAAVSGFAIGPGPQNLNSGNGQQTNATMSGGMQNTQYIAQAQHFLSPSLETAKDYLDALFVTDPAVDRDKLERLKGAPIQDDAPHLLHIRGGPGKGKTMLSIYLTGELDLMKRSILVYYFFMAGDPRRDNATAMMRTLIWQLVNTAAEPQLVNHLSECMVSTVRSKQVMSEPETMWKMFTALVGALQQREVYCIIDGLDECISDDQDWIARKLIGNGPDGGLTILRTLGLSRPTLDLRSARHIDLDGAASPEIASDVRLYISTATTAIADRLDLSEAKRTMLEFDLAERAQGSFLWISFAISACARKGTYTRLMESLEKMPEGLFGIYRRILDDIEDDCKSDVVRVLQWVAMAKRPLHVRELAFLLRPTTTAFEEQIELTCDHIALCGPFLQLQEVEAHDWDTLFGNTRFQTLLQPVPRYRNRTQVNFVHDTVKEYLLNTAEHTGKKGASYLLLLHNPSLNIKNGRGHTAFDHAAWTNHKAAGLLVAARESEPTDLAERWERVRTAAVHAHLADYEVDLAHEAANPVIPTDEAPVIDWVEWMTQEMEDLNTTKQSLILRFGNSEDTGAKES
ncbi:hypothetical protein B0A48_00903 [Cryoendolithus antarcticus]|uniref:Nephrocystin 3-like N-terminal domain-containing protein n=1 Tax=Cryoendolithus antarcticus TaxID=1507870 RepID=A0A1V8TRU2_9PEZI|nr:hypothetical protein B0A48_00903 [Cryoendolithus antarcticus]